MKALTANASKLLAIAVIGTTAAACSGDATGPSGGGGTTPPPPPAPTLENRYDVQFTVRYLEITSTDACDARTPIVNTPTNGEFQYRIEAEGPSDFFTMESDGYGNVLGKAYPAKGGETIDFTNKTFSFKDLKDGELVALRLYASEWDGPVVDSGMNNRRGLKEFQLSDRQPIGTLKALEISASGDCTVSLVFDQQIDKREVEVES